MKKLSFIRKRILHLLKFRNDRPLLSSNSEKIVINQMGASSDHSSALFMNIPGNENSVRSNNPRTGFNRESVDRFISSDQSLTLLNAYLFSNENFQKDIPKLKNILEMKHIIFEIGCGSGEVAWQIAKKNPQTGVIAIDKYDWTISPQEGSHYQKVALAWRNKKLEVQEHSPENLVLLRAGYEIIRFFPDYSIDSVLLMNPEPKVCEAFLRLLCENSWYRKIKSGFMQIMVVPFSREMGISACSGFECDYEQNYPGNLNYLNVGHFQFYRGEKFHWGLDLSRASAYSRNSARNDVYVYGNKFQAPSASAWQNLMKKILIIP